MPTRAEQANCEIAISRSAAEVAGGTSKTKVPSISSVILVTKGHVRETFTCSAGLAVEDGVCLIRKSGCGITTGKASGVGALPGRAIARKTATSGEVSRKAATSTTGPLVGVFAKNAVRRVSVTATSVSTSSRTSEVAVRPIARRRGGRGRFATSCRSHCETATVLQRGR